MFVMVLCGAPLVACFFAAVSSRAQALALLHVTPEPIYEGLECHPSRVGTPPGGCMLWRTGKFRRGLRDLVPPPPLPSGACGKPATTFADGRFDSGHWRPGLCELSSLSSEALRAVLSGRRVLFQGDSMLRQMFNALVSMVRGDQNIVDPWFHSNATYSFNETSDAYVCAATEPGTGAQPDAAFIAGFVWDPQMSAVSAIDFAAWDAVIASPIHWSEGTGFAALRALEAEAATIYVTTPASTHIGNVNISARNAWISQHAPHFVPLSEMDAAGMYARDTPDNQHFQCQSLAPLGQHVLHAEFKMPPTGDCHDTVNRNAVDVIVQLTRFRSEVCCSRLPPPPLKSLFAFNAASAPALVNPFSRNGSLAEPFIDNFQRCMTDPVHTNITQQLYGPYPRGAPRPIAGFYKASEPHPTFDMANATLESVPNSLLRLPSPISFRELVLTTFGRATPVIMHCFASEYGGKGKRAGRNGFFPMLQSWLGHVARVGRLNHVLLVGQTHADCLMATDFAPCVIHSPGLGYPDAMNAWAQNFRWVYSDLLLRGGVEHMSVDADAFFMADPVPLLASLDADIAGLSDRLYDGTGPLGYCNDTPCQSTGFTFMRSTLEVTQLVTEFAQTFSGGIEQGVFNTRVANATVGNGRYTLLPNSGSAAFANWNVVLPALKDGRNLALALLHMGGQQGGVAGASADGVLYWMDSKEYIFRCAELWLDETNFDTLPA